MAQHSARGSLCDEKPRHWVRSLLYINIFLTATEFLWTVMGTYFSIHDYISCQQDDQARPVIVAVLVVVCLSYLLIGIKVSSYYRHQSKIKKCNSFAGGLGLALLAAFSRCCAKPQLSQPAVLDALRQEGGPCSGFFCTMSLLNLNLTCWTGLP